MTPKFCLLHRLPYQSKFRLDEKQSDQKVWVKNCLKPKRKSCPKIDSAGFHLKIDRFAPFSNIAKKLLDLGLSRVAQIGKIITQSGHTDEKDRLREKRKKGRKHVLVRRREQLTGKMSGPNIISRMTEIKQDCPSLYCLSRPWRLRLVQTSHRSLQNRKGLQQCRDRKFLDLCRNVTD